MLKDWFIKVLAVLAAIGTVVGAAKIWGFYPIGVIVILVASLVAAVLLLFERRAGEGAHLAGDAAAEREHDTWVVREVREILGRDDVEIIRSWDYGGSWRQEWIEPLRQVVHIDDVEHRPLDVELAAEFRRLLDATHAFVDYYALNTWAERNRDDWRNVGWTGGEAEDLDPEHRDLWNGRARRLEALVDEVANAYDAFVDLARRRRLLDLE